MPLEQVFKFVPGHSDQSNDNYLKKGVMMLPINIEESWASMPNSLLILLSSLGEDHVKRSEQKSIKVTTE
jgi:hypothetical protein